MQQLREAFPEPCRYTYMILDRDRKFDAKVLAFLDYSRVASEAYERAVALANGLAERWIKG
ncbi:MAG TPA: hypothetical protein VIY49_36130 [Bryobacteraceae bacterium]